MILWLLICHVGRDCLLADEKNVLKNGNFFFNWFEFAIEILTLRGFEVVCVV